MPSQRCAVRGDARDGGGGQPGGAQRGRWAAPARHVGRGEESGAHDGLVVCGPKGPTNVILRRSGCRIKPASSGPEGDRLYAIDADSTAASHPGGWKKGVWIGSIAKGLPDAFVPDEQAGEGVVVTPDGTMLGAVNVAPRGITRYGKK